MALDFETRLDSALNRIAQGAPSLVVMADVPEAADLLVVAEQLQKLAPAPAPELSRGRARFLAEATRLTDAARLERSSHLRSVSSTMRFRLSFTLGVVAVVIVIVGNLLFVQIPPSPTRIPTYTATPTRFSLAPEIAPRSELVLSSAGPNRAPVPAPVPVPGHVLAPSRNFISISYPSWLSQWMS